MVCAVCSFCTFFFLIPFSATVSQEWCAYKHDWNSDITPQFYLNSTNNLPPPSYHSLVCDWPSSYWPYSSIMARHDLVPLSNAWPQTAIDCEVTSTSEGENTDISPLIYIIWKLGPNHLIPLHPLTQMTHNVIMNNVTLEQSAWIVRHWILHPLCGWRDWSN